MGVGVLEVDVATGLLGRIHEHTIEFPSVHGKVAIRRSGPVRLVLSLSTLIVESAPFNPGCHRHDFLRQSWGHACQGVDTAACDDKIYTPPFRLLLTWIIAPLIDIDAKTVLSQVNGQKAANQPPTHHCGSVAFRKET